MTGISHPINDIETISNKGLALGLLLASPMLAVSIYFIAINRYLIVWESLPYAMVFLFLWAMWYYMWKERTKIRNISKIKRNLPDFIYELYCYSGFTFLTAMIFSFVFPLISFILIIVGLKQLRHAKRVIEKELIPQLQQLSLQTAGQPRSEIFR